MILNPAEMDARHRYKTLIGTVLPRPIAWVSTADAHGNPNLAPFSYFTAVCGNPMTLLFCPGVLPTRDDGKKDTLRNVEETREFVINLTNEDTAQAMNLSATDLPPGESEFDWAGVTPAPCEVVRAPRVAEAPIAYECTLDRIVTVSDQPGGGHAVFGTVQRIHIRDDIYEANGRIDLAAYKPIARLGGNIYAHLNDFFEMERVPAPSNRT